MQETSSPKKIIITEKADAARRIAYILSNGTSKQKRSKGLNYIEFGEGNDHHAVIPLSGHIVAIDFNDSLKDWKSTRLEDIISSNVVHKVTNKSAFNSLVSLTDKAESIIVATDYDREGELIGVEALDIVDRNVLQKIHSHPEIKRARFSALTPDDIRKAFSDLAEVDNDLAQSASAREEIDLFWGAVLTRFFSLTSNRLGRNFLSVGRVQTPTLALVVRRELEIRDFVEKPYWTLSILFNKRRDFLAHYKEGAIWDKKDADRIYQEINGQNGTVKEFSRNDERIYKPPPFNTTEFIREASRIGVQPARAMKIAEDLYTRGYISYPRTDNTVYQRSINLKGVLNKLKETEFSELVQKVLSQEIIRPSRGKTEATDHPPIYPVSAAKQTDLRGDQWKIYELIVRRFLATLYREGTREVTYALIDVKGHEFEANGQTVTDPGWLELYPYRKVEETIIPELQPGTEVRGKEWNLNEEKTKPPRRYDMASLIKKMEELNLGTKSTRHDIIEKLQQRGFIEGNPVRPTYLGMGLIESLLMVQSTITEPDMTATLETEMDGIANRQRTKKDVVQISKNMLLDVLKQFKSKEDVIRETIISSLRKGNPVGKCPVHGTDIVLMRNKDYSRLKCEQEGCKIDFPSPLRGTPQILEDKCEVCGLPLMRVIRKGQSPETRCIDPKCQFNSSRSMMGKCPQDGGDLIVRQSRFGKRFLGCANYPKCTTTFPLPQMGQLKNTGEVCPSCGAPLIIAFRNRRAWKFCPKMDCQYNKEKKEKTKETGESKVTASKKKGVKSSGRRTKKQDT